MNLSIDLDRFPADLQPVVQSWFVWRVVDLRAAGRDLDCGDRLDWSQSECWQSKTPVMSQSGDLLLGRRGGEAVRCLASRSGRFELYTIDRGIMCNPDFVFATLDDAEKQLLIEFASAARASASLPSITSEWYRLGLEAGTNIEPFDVSREYDYALFVDGEVKPRGWMYEMNAVRFSHAVFRTYGQIDELFRKNIPPEWFSMTFV